MFWNSIPAFIPNAIDDKFSHSISFSFIKPKICVESNTFQRNGFLDFLYVNILNPRSSLLIISSSEFVVCIKFLYSPTFKYFIDSVIESVWIIFFNILDEILNVG